MSEKTRLHTFWLPMLVGALLAAPAFVLTHEQPTAEAVPSVAQAEPELACGPFAEAFSAMRLEADRIAALASASIDAEGEAMTAAAQWTEIHAAARALDSWVWEASSESAPLTMRETAILSSAAPITGDLRWEIADIAGRLRTRASEGSAPGLGRDMLDVVQKAGAVARLLDPLVLCRDLGKEVTYAPHRRCETLDPEYQVAMDGSCLQ